MGSHGALPRLRGRGVATRGALPRLRGRGVATRGARLACETDLAASAIPICGHFTQENFGGSGSSVFPLRLCLRFHSCPFAVPIRGPFSRLLSILSARSAREREDHNIGNQQNH
jgi:hypothetical protein